MLAKPDVHGIRCSSLSSCLRGGASDGDAVVVRGVERLRPGQKVQIAERVSAATRVDG